MAGDYDIYYGLWLVFKDGELSETIGLDADVDGIDICDPQKVYVKCGECNQWMKYRRRSWTCPVCGAKVRHRQVYDQIQKENEEFYDEYDDIY